MKIAASLGIDLSKKSWLRDDDIDEEFYTGAFRYSVYVFSESKREYVFEDSFFSLKLAQNFIQEQLHRTDKVDLRKELYLEGRWKCSKHIEMISKWLTANTIHSFYLTIAIINSTVIINLHLYYL